MDSVEHVGGSSSNGAGHGAHLGKREKIILGVGIGGGVILLILRRGKSGTGEPPAAGGALAAASATPQGGTVIGQGAFALTGNETIPPAFLGPPTVNTGVPGSPPIPYSVDHPGFILEGQRDFRNDPWAVAYRAKGQAKRAATPLPPGGRIYSGTGIPGPNDYEWDYGFGYRQDFVPGGTPTNPQLEYHISGET